MKEDRLNGLEKAAGCDDEQRMLAQVIGQGWPREVSALVRRNWNFRDTMVVQDGIVYKGSQVVVPKSLRSDSPSTKDVRKEGGKTKTESHTSPS